MKCLLPVTASALLLFSLASASPPSAGQVVIINTGDRLSPGYRVTVAPSGALAVRFGPARHPQRRTDQMIAANRRRFFADLAGAEPLGGLSTGSAGSRPQIFVRYRGRQSPNLREARSEAGRVLYQDVKQILHVLRMPIPDVP